MVSVAVLLLCFVMFFAAGFLAGLEKGRADG